jgi:eukaryotic-like serine/threonine-protein kinase
MGAMAGKDDIFIIGAESPAGEEDGPQERAEARNAFAPAPEEQQAPPPVGRRPRRRPLAVACGAALAVGLVAFAITHLGGAPERSPDPSRAATPPRVEPSPEPAKPSAHGEEQATPSLPRKAAGGARRRSRSHRRRVRRRARESAAKRAAAEVLPPPPTPAPAPEEPPSAAPPASPESPPANPASRPSPRPEFGIER